MDRQQEGKIKIYREEITDKGISEQHAVTTLENLQRQASQVK